ncbi:phospholipase D family protein [Janthinobacterium sp. EB271-G4-7A]|uniref:phospholipase D family protein n=1 Tax=Janthinobacterium sp. EB271-G4-7A TaxID=2775056 RepID=UPI001E484E2D|nr:phospholipase D family protein [Janthinobacterium sp. EB271-G4-7A]MCC7698776.1 phospholipase D family protein [Janthinobacterium sp. EB271-G4-7A]
MLVKLLLLATLFAVLSIGALYSYGRFAERSLGPPGMALPVAADATLLDRVLAPQLEQRPGHSGTALIDDNLEAFALRALSAREAGRSLDLQYYIWHNDVTGRLLVRELLRAADRGVRVRVLLDDINARGQDAAILALDSHPLIDVRIFNPSRNRDGIWLRAVEMALRAVSLNRRMHNKAWIVDGRVALVGGRNIGDEYFDAAEQVNFQDADLLLVGPAVQQTSDIFDRFWNSRAVIPIGALHAGKDASAPELQAVRARLDALTGELGASPYLRQLTDTGQLQAHLDGRIRLHWSGQVQVLSDPPEKAAPVASLQRNEHWLMHSLLPLLTDAREEALLTSPYFVPGTALTQTLGEKVAAGVKVQVLTNSLAATDVALVHAGYARYRQELLGGGIELYELKTLHRKRISLMGSSRASLHTKAVVIDGQRGFVGSFNLDPRSAQLNTEMGVLFNDAALAADMRTLFLHSTASDTSYRLLLDNGALRWSDATEEPAKVWTHDPEAGIWRRMLVCVMRWLPIESQL